MDAEPGDPLRLEYSGFISIAHFRKICIKLWHLVLYLCKHRPDFDYKDGDRFFEEAIPIFKFPQHWVQTSAALLWGYLL